MKAVTPRTLINSPAAPLPRRLRPNLVLAADYPTRPVTVDRAVLRRRCNGRAGAR